MAEPVPEAFLCSLTLDIMEDLVITADGQSYERAAIAQWLAAGTRTSPLTGAALPSAHLTPNVALRQAIAEWSEKLPMALDPGCLELTEELVGVGSFGRVVPPGSLTLPGGRAQDVAVKQLPALSQAEQAR